MTIDARVQAGIAMLDAGDDPTWRERINLETLSMHTTDRCVFGQLYGSTDAGILKYGLLPPDRIYVDVVAHDRSDPAFKVGILTLIEPYGSDAKIEDRMDADYYLLTLAWRRALRTED